MSDIPIGSPPVPPGRHAAPSGWYPDPLDPAQERYWDGWQWSRTTRPDEKRRASGPQAPYSPPAGPNPGPSWAPPPSGPGGGHPYQPQPDPSQPYPQQPPAPYPQQPPASYGQAPYPPLQQPRPGAKADFTADGVRLSGWWWRALAIIIDILIVAVIAAAIASPIYLEFFGRLGDYFNEALEAAQRGLPAPAQPPVETFISTTDSLLLTAIAVAVETTYIVAFLRWKSATPGKLIAGLRVVPVDQGRSTDPLSWSTIIARTMVWVLGGIAACLWILRLIDVLFPLWQPKRQALHDLAARTQVVKIR